MPPSIWGRDWKEEGSILHTPRRRASAIISGALLGLILILGTSVGAVAAPGDKSPGESNPGQVAQVEKIKKKIADAGGGRILGTKVVDYVPENSASPTLMSYPGSCSLSVTLYVIYRTSTYSSVYNESSNYCPGATSSSLDMTIIKRDTITGWKATVASNWGGWSGEAEYTCPTGNVSDFRAETWGQVTYNGTRYTASAYDGDAWSGFYRYNCG
jgi:hypothetical protein